MKDNLIKKIDEEIAFIINQKFKIKEIVIRPLFFDSLKGRYRSFNLVKKDLGFFSCSIKYFDDGKVRQSLLL